MEDSASGGILALVNSSPTAAARNAAILVFLSIWLVMGVCREIRRLLDHLSATHR